MNKHTLCSWSGGKDSCYALIHAIQSGYIPRVLLTVLNEEGKISRSHGIPSSILQKQAEVIGLPAYMISSSWEDYEKKFTASLHKLKEEFDLRYAVFGDIDLQEHRDWEEKVCAHAGLTAILPLWKQDRKKLVMGMLNTGIETIIVSCNETMGSTFIGRKITEELIDELESLHIDPCGENGEYHTLVVDCPLFSDRLSVHVTETVKHGNYWFSVLSL
jgi:uncharacterized protein (TIGR00290 family)